MTLNSTLRRPGRYRFRFCIRSTHEKVEFRHDNAYLVASRIEGMVFVQSRASRN